MKEETYNQRNERHTAHQQMLEEHRERKQIARERHRPQTGRPWHQIKIIPIQLI